MFYKSSARVRKYTSAKGYRYTKNTKGSDMLNTLTVTIKHPHADYFESQITYVGAK